MNRRRFIEIALQTVAAAHVDVTSLLPDAPLWVPHPDQLLFFEESKLPRLMLGIPYHQSNASIGSWLGFERLTWDKNRFDLIEDKSENKDK